MFTFLKNSPFIYLITLFAFFFNLWTIIIFVILNLTSLNNLFTVFTVNWLARTALVQMLLQALNCVFFKRFFRINFRLKILFIAIVFTSKNLVIKNNTLTNSNIHHRHVDILFLSAYNDLLNGSLFHHTLKQINIELFIQSYYLHQIFSILKHD